jgi:hypothetical protein
MDVDPKISLFEGGSASSEGDCLLKEAITTDGFTSSPLI